MTTDSSPTADEGTLFLGEAWSDPLEAGIQDQIRIFIEELIEEELDAPLGTTTIPMPAAAQRAHLGHRAGSCPEDRASTNQNPRRRELSLLTVHPHSRDSGFVVCPACSIARECKSPVQPDGGEGLAKYKGVTARWRLKAVRSKTAT